MSFVFKPAIVTRMWYRLGFSGVTNSGKTRAALTVAEALKDTVDNPVVGMIDTEKRGRLWAREFDFLVLEMNAPYSPDRYIGAMEAAEKAGINVLIIDSGSHVYAGAGGILEIADDASKKTKNPYGGWGTASPLYHKFVEKIYNYPGHIILTLRSKMAYEIQTDDKGKKTPVKIGLQPIMRDQFEYEFTCFWELDQDHVAYLIKDSTPEGLFANRPASQVDKEFCHLLVDWIQQTETREQIYERLLEDAMRHLQDLRGWWKTNIRDIQFLGRDLTERLTVELKGHAKPQAAANYESPGSQSDDVHNAAA